MKKPGLMLAIGMKPKVGEEKMAPESGEEEGAESDGNMKAAAQSLIDAVQSGDAEAVADALKLAVMSCKDEDCRK